jgi:hypothetical protein
VSRSTFACLSLIILMSAFAIGAAVHDRQLSLLLTPTVSYA